MWHQFLFTNKIIIRNNLQTTASKRTHRSRLYYTQLSNTHMNTAISHKSHSKHSPFKHMATMANKQRQREMMQIKHVFIPFERRQRHTPECETQLNYLKRSCGRVKRKKELQASSEKIRKRIRRRRRRKKKKQRRKLCDQLVVKGIKLCNHQ